jgi:2-polyprenyl-3-methyl-5-hydroxy-6-metoxy-1,4-benzoquinol methylase
MDDPIEINLRNWNERAAIHARDATGDYMLDRFRAGEDTLHAIEAAELGDVAGMRILHLQCHIGRDTLCLARRGADVTGLDFSSAALQIARQLADETGLRARFVQGRVSQALQLTPGPFDLVFATWGTICWLPDVQDWAKVIASVLAQGANSTSLIPTPHSMCLSRTATNLFQLMIFKRPPTDHWSSFRRRLTPVIQPSCNIKLRANGSTHSHQSLAHSLALA